MDFRHSPMKRLTHFKLPNSGLASDTAIVKIFPLIFLPENILWIIPMQRF
jgi:hypothetical protein